MATADSDSDGSHISSTPPRHHPQPAPPKSSLLTLQSSYNPRPKSRPRVSSRPNSIFLNPKPTPNKHKRIRSKPKPKPKSQPSEPEEASTPNPPSTSHSDLSNICRSSVQIHRGFKKSVDDPALAPIDTVVPANSCSMPTSFSKFQRQYSIPEERDEVHRVVRTETAKEEETGGGHGVESEGNSVGKVGSEEQFVGKPSNLIGGGLNPLPSKCLNGDNESNPPLEKSVRKPAHLIGGNSNSAPLKRAKVTNEGNFVRLNINGYGKSKFKNKFKKKYGSASSSYSSKRYQWRNKKKMKVEGEGEGLCEEDGLVMENPKMQKQRENLKTSREFIEQAVLDARNEPSDENLTKLLKLSHGYDSFRDGQLEAIKQVLAGNSTMLLLPTGAGKSLCYQLPTLVLPGLTVVVSPLLALMVDQLRQLPPMIQGGLLSSNQTSEEASETVRQLLEGTIKVLFVSPERFLNEDFIIKIRAAPLISLVVVDEAHCLSEWSHNFRPSYLRLRASLLQTALNVQCILAMTATATTKTLQATMHALDIPPMNLVQKSQIRENLQLSVTSSGNRMKDLMALMKSSPFKEIQSIIIYCKFQYETDLLSKHLCDSNIRAKSYHSGIPAKDRNRTQELFCSNKIRVVVATVAFGMGLDKSDVGAVIHYSLPGSLEEYVQEIGRAGRDSRLAFCHLFHDDSTYFKLRSLLFSDGVDEYAMNKFLCHVFSSDKNSPRKICSLVKESASRKFDMKEEVMLTILTQLELGEVQYLRLLPQLSITCTLFFHKTSPALLARTNIVVTEILKKSDTRQGSYVFDLPTVANNVGITTIALSNELQYLKSKGEITYEVKDPAFCYRILKNPGDFCGLTTQLTKWLSEVEWCKVRKLDEMFNVVTFATRLCKKTNGCSGTLHTQCLQSRISDYFSKDDEADKPQYEVPSAMGGSSPFLRADIKVFLQSNSHAKFTPRAVARIMHGIASPAYPSTIWSKTHFWGRYSQIDFPAVMESAAAELMNFAGKEAI